MVFMATALLKNYAEKLNHKNFAFRKTGILRPIFFILFFLHSIAGFSYQGDLIFKKISIEQGLSQSSINAVLEDKFGFIWIGTDDGLNLYDGYGFKIFKHDPKNKNSIPGNIITSLLEDKSGKIWIGTDISGLGVYDRFKGEFTHFVRTNKNFKGPFSNNITTLFEDNEGLIWIGTLDGGLSSYDPTSEKFSHYKSRYTDPNSIAGNFISCISQDAKGRIWIGTGNAGLSCIDKTTGKVLRSFFAEGEFTSIINDEISCFLKNPFDSAHVYCLDAQGRLYRINPDKKTYQEIYQQQTKKIIDQNLDASCGLMDKRGFIWLGTSDGGVFIIDPKSGYTQQYRFDPKKKNSLSLDYILNISEDKNGSIWIGTDGGGINFFNPRTTQFERYFRDPFNTKSLNDNDIWAINKFGDFILAGTSGGGINFINDRTGEYKYLLTEEVNSSFKHTRSLENLGNGIFWAATSGGGIVEFNASTGTFLRRILHDAENANSPSTNQLNEILKDKRGIIWVATANRGLLSYQPSNQRWEKFRNQPNDPQSIADNNVRDIFMDKQGNLWLGFTAGLGKMDTLRKTFRKFTHQAKIPGSINNNDVLCIFQDSYGTLWVGTSGGINGFNAKNESFISLDETNGLPNSVVYSIQEDNKKRLWFSSNKGLCVFSLPTPETIQKAPGKALKQMMRTLRNYDDSEGLTSNEFNSGVSYKDEKGYLFFGGVSGFVKFHPDSLEDNFLVPPVHITSLSVFGKELPLVNTFKDSRAIQLKYNENYLSFEFISLNYLSPAKTKFAYQLEGFDKEAIVGHSRRFAGYTNLDPGDYTFKVWVSANNGSWSGKPAEIKITILPPFWKKAWFYILISILLAGLIWLLNFLRERKFRVDKIKLEKIVDERTRELRIAKEQAEKSMKAKETFLSTMSHEIRTPMNAVIAMTHFLLDEDPRPNQKENLNTLKFSAENLLVLINDILDFSKIDAGKVEFEEVPFNLKLLSHDLLHAFQSTAQEKKLELKSHYDKNLPSHVVGDPVRLNQILTNLISNGIKFTKKGFIDLSIQKISESESHLVIEFSVTDSGIGIPQDKFDLIFESFEQASKDTTRKFGGTGLGLTITKRLLELQGSYIQLESTLGEGSKFFFQLSFKKDTSNPGKLTDTIEKTKENSLKGIKVLIVEDNNVNQLIASKFLEKWGAVVRIAENGIEGVEMVNNNHYDIVLMDLQMPEMDGFEATRNIRNTKGSYYRDLPILALTAAAMVEVREQVMEAGMNDYISKPFNPNELFSKINRHLAKEN